MPARVVVGLSVAVFVAVSVSCDAQAEQLPSDGGPRTTVAAPAFVDAISHSRDVIAPRLRRHPAITVAVAVDGTLVWSEARGWADVSTRRLATPSTRFRVYSVFKPVTAALALRMEAAGSLALDLPIGRYVETLPSTVADSNLIQLLTHTSGVRHYDRGEWMRVSRAGCVRAAEALAPFVGDPLLFAPGSRTQYSSFGYVLASAVLEAVAGRAFSELVADDVLRPLQMSNTVLDDSRADPQAATPYESEGRLRPSVGIDNSCKAGAGGFRSTAEDLARFGSALLAGTELPPGALERFGTPATVQTGSNTTVGFGIGLSNLEGLGPSLVQSGGAIGGRAILLIVPAPRIVVALASNLEGDSFGTEASEIARVFARQR